MATPPTPQGRHRHRRRHRHLHHRPSTPHNIDIDQARARHTQEWSAIAAEAARVLLRKRRAYSLIDPPTHTTRRIRSRKTYEEPLLWTLAHRYNRAAVHTHGLQPSLRLWESGDLAMQLGTPYWGLRHILRRHRANFAAHGVVESEVCELVRWHMVNGKPVFGDQRSRWYELELGGGRSSPGKEYLCVIYAAGAGEELGTVLSAYPATEKRLYVERRRNRGLKKISEVKKVSSPAVLGSEGTSKQVYPHGHAEKEPETQISRPGEVNDIPETMEIATEPKPGVTETSPVKLELAPDLAVVPASAIITPKPEPTALITPGPAPTTTIIKETPKKRFKIKRIWHSFTTPQIRRLFLTNEEVDALPGTTQERSLRRRLGKSIHATFFAPPRISPRIIVPSPSPSPETSVQAPRIQRYPDTRPKEPPKLAHRVAVRPYVPVPRVHRTRAPPYRPRPRITKFISRRKIVRSIRGRPFMRVDRPRGLRRPARTRARRRLLLGRDRRRERWSVTRLTPGDILSVLAALVRSRKGRDGVDRRWVRAGALGLAGAGKAFPRLGGAWGMWGTGAGSLSRGWQAAREQQQQQVRKIHTQLGVGIPVAVLPRRVVSSSSVGKGVIPALWRVLGRRMFL
ncbi:uncharacterized protein H6S33_004590 [Morchella sextelata]|uniref:uncharacterized protein n=1 Tax=Morchella sextelata TaxID=1174677 RepID=UPI001D049031|nr:uncharacterized protein H6S33_004590 [Morchella sextelata]KAH0605368.1 hypothetical protein H6S33_004590 [Morchella sextelata]